MHLVTGGTGLIGSHVLYTLVSQGLPVRALVREDSDRSWIKKLFAFKGLQDQHFQQIEFCIGDVLDVPSLLDATEGVEHVYHCAALVSYHAKDRSLMYQINVEGTGNMINVAIECGVKKFAHVSSIAALGRNAHEEWIDERAEWKESDLNTHYAITKFLSEMEVWRGVQEGLPAVIINPGVVIGAGNSQRSSGQLFTKIAEGLKYYPLGGSGFVGAMDCAKTLVELCRSGIANERFVLVGENLSMQEAFAGIAAALGVRVPDRAATPFALQVAHKAEWLKEFFTGKRALITRETLMNSANRSYYRNDKIKEALAFQFTPIANCMQEAAAFLK